jgi:hypothetical protein
MLAIYSLILAIFCVFRADSVLADMTSANYQIQWDEISSGGGFSSSATYGLRDSAGTGSAGAAATSASYGITPGFRSGVYDDVIRFTPYVQDSSSQVAAVSATSGPFNEVTITTTAGFSVGSYILVVQNEGANQVSVMGQVTAVGATTLGIRSNYAGTAPTIDGSNDYVYLMNSSAAMGLGTLSSSTVATHTIGWVSTSDVDDGYSVYMFSGSELISGSDIIPGVADGTVTAGSSEYGGRSSDTSLATSTFDTQDTAFTTDPALVASVASHPFLSIGFVTLKASIESAQAGGSYAQTLTAIFVGEY